MRLLTKNNYKFATGIFWQIPDEGRRAINLTKLARDTGHNMCCYVKSIKPTWGFCHKRELHNEKKIASLGKFIIETSSLSATYANSIICYKFKDSYELDEVGNNLQTSLFGYIVLLNGTICPDEGEYVAEFTAIRESIISKAKKYEIETLYLPSDVAYEFSFETSKNVSEQDLKYLIPNVCVLTLSSDEIYWKNQKFKSNFKKSLLIPLATQTTQKYKIMALCVLISIFIYLLYGSDSENILTPISSPQFITPLPNAVSPEQLINACIVNNDRYFGSLGMWSLISLKCNSLENTLTFESEVDTTLKAFTELAQGNQNITFNDKIGTYTQKLKLNKNATTKKMHINSLLSADFITTELQQAAINYNFSLNMQDKSYGKHKFTLNS